MHVQHCGKISQRRRCRVFMSRSWRWAASSWCVPTWPKTRWWRTGKTYASTHEELWFNIFNIFRIGSIHFHLGNMLIFISRKGLDHSFFASNFQEISARIVVFFISHRQSFGDFDWLQAGYGRTCSSKWNKQPVLTKLRRGCCIKDCRRDDIFCPWNSKQKARKSMFQEGISYWANNKKTKNLWQFQCVMFFWCLRIKTY